jgi:hypothetical protein
MQNSGIIFRFHPLCSRRDDVRILMEIVKRSGWEPQKLGGGEVMVMCGGVIRFASNDPDYRLVGASVSSVRQAGEKAGISIVISTLTSSLRDSMAEVKECPFVLKKNGQDFFRV